MTAETSKLHNCRGCGREPCISKQGQAWRIDCICGLSILKWQREDCERAWNNAMGPKPFVNGRQVLEHYGANGDSA